MLQQRSIVSVIDRKLMQGKNRELFLFKKTRQMLNERL